MELAAKINTFTDLNAWQAGHNLVLGIYTATKNFPAAEQFALTSQIRRAIVSVTSNIAEGFTRQTKADKIHFYVMAHASLTEVQNQLIIAKDVGYLPDSTFDQLFSKSVEVHKLLTGLIKSIKGSMK